MPAPLRPLLAAVSSSIVHHPLPASMPDHGPDRRPFITISREAGAGGRTLMSALVDRLSAREPGGAAWAGYDHELLEKVAERHGLDTGRLAQLEPQEPHWLAQMFKGFGAATPEGPTRPQVYRRVVNTIRQLARDGRCVIVGRGAALATADMPGGVHVRLVAPYENRVANLAAQRQMSRAHAGAEVQRLDRARERFFKQYWGVHPLGPEHFHIGLNTARLSEPQLLAAIIALLPAHQAAPTPARRAAATVG